MLAAFNHIYCDNQEQKAKQKDLKNLQFDQKTENKTGVKENVVIKVIIATKEMINALIRDYRRNGLRNVQELARTYPSQHRLKVVKVKTPLRRDGGSILLAQGS